jgi:hypothetical protein
MRSFSRKWWAYRGNSSKMCFCRIQDLFPVPCKFTMPAFKPMLLRVSKMFVFLGHFHPDKNSSRLPEMKKICARALIPLQENLTTRNVLALQELFLLCKNCSCFARTVLALQDLFLLCKNCSCFARTVLALQELFLLCKNCSCFARSVLALQELFMPCLCKNEIPFTNFGVLAM